MNTERQKSGSLSPECVWPFPAGAGRSRVPQLGATPAQARRPIAGTRLPSLRAPRWPQPGHRSPRCPVVCIWVSGGPEDGRGERDRTDGTEGQRGTDGRGDRADRSAQKGGGEGRSHRSGREEGTGPELLAGVICRNWARAGARPNPGPVRRRACELGPRNRAAGTGDPSRDSSSRLPQPRPAAELRRSAEHLPAPTPSVRRGQRLIYPAKNSL